MSELSRETTHKKINGQVTHLMVTTREKVAYDVKINLPISPVRLVSKNVTSLLIIDTKKSFLKLYPMRSPIYPNIPERIPTHNAETYERRKIKLTKLWSHLTEKNTYKNND